jgi:hypothetical protein
MLRRSSLVVSPENELPGAAYSDDFAIFAYTLETNFAGSSIFVAAASQRVSAKSKTANDNVVNNLACIKSP